MLFAKASLALLAAIVKSHGQALGSIVTIDTCEKAAKRFLKHVFSQFAVAEERLKNV